MGTVLGTICQFSYSELENATNKFSDSNLIGLGGSSYVYRGPLKDGRIVSVKRLKIQGGGLDADSIFSTEVELLLRLHHCHVVPLLSYCSQSGGKHADRLLVFEYMPNGNLRDCLDGISGETMSWETCVRVAIGAARGLEYLHEEAAPKILHRDVKSTNIIQDKNWRAKATPRLQDSKQVSSELPDSCLKGNFPEEEMQVMAYLAKECLLLDPDTRPTMIEVVQILSTIAPDKSKRRNIPVNFYQMPSTHNMKNEALLERHQTVIEDLYDTDDHMSMTSRSSRVVDDEAVDLIEPRFESFGMANVKSP
ncbi:Receptor-like serine/threonine-protein kinase NCRK [Hibiscus syriacus]|uniref:Receptor-like serine/threonine-protein kinase NCRK n=1 Tax=Hibiscus syriacus TaxID=106335 RepID=A0A6A3BC89_HIBSY|nr:Receptor-like serine/threonine-protein kinase NCRK [Hibiscus syriacus]